MQLDFHIWRTDDGRLVAHGDPDAAFLKYPAGGTIPQEDRLAAEVLAKARPGAKTKPAAKRRRGTADKQAAKGEDKSAAPGDGEGAPGEGSEGAPGEGSDGAGADESTAPGGLTINRLKDQPEA